MKSLFTFLLIIIHLSIINAQYYWVGNAGSWSDYSTHWATSSGGTDFHSQIPSDTDQVYFDENSFSMDDQTVILDVKGECNNFTWEVNQAVSFFSNNQQLNIKGSAILDNDVDYDFNKVNFINSTEAQSINSNGAGFGSNSIITISAGTSIELLDEVICNNFSLFRTITTNNHNITAEGTITLTGFGITLNLGTSTISARIFRESCNTTTYNIDAATFIASQSINLSPNNLDNFSYHKFILGATCKVIGAGSIDSLIVDIEEDYSEIVFQKDAKIRCQHWVSVTDKHHPLSIRVMGDDGHGTIEKLSGELNLSHVSLKGIHGIGGADFNADPGIDLGNNDGWNFTDIPSDKYYWVGNGGDWSDLSHWATSSGGGDFYNSLPSAFDQVFFDENSTTLDNQVIAILVDPRIKSINCEGVNNTTTLQKVNGSIRVNGDVNIVDINADILNFEIRSTEEITINIGIQEEIGNVNFREGGIFNLVGDLKASSMHLDQGGILNTNNYDIKLKKTCSFRGPCQVNLGSSYIDTDIFNPIETTDLKVEINPGTSIIRTTQLFNGNDKQFHHLILDEKSEITGSNMFNTLEFIAGVEAILPAADTQTVSSNLIMNGTSSQYIKLESSEDGTPSTLLKTSGTVLGNYLILTDNYATGGANFIANQSVDLGNNMGWNITEVVPRNFYWIGDSGEWSDINHWANSSGGSMIHNDIPGILDNVYLDANSFTTNNGFIDLQDNSYSVKTLDCSTLTNNPTLGGGSDATLNIYGSLKFEDNITTFIKNINLLGPDDHTISAAKDEFITQNGTLFIDTDGAVNFESNISTFILRFSRGEINTNNFDFAVNGWTTFVSNGKKEFNLGTSHYFSKSFLTENSIDSVYINGSDAKILCSDKFQIISAEPNIDINLRHLAFINTGFSSEINSSFMIDSLSVEAGKELKIDPDSDLTVNELILKGTSDKPIFLHSSEENVIATIQKNTGIVEGEYLELKDIRAEGDALFYATNSMDLGNVEGWIFGSVATKNQVFTSIRSFPNPTGNHVIITIGNIGSGEYKLYNNLGRLVLSNSFYQLSDNLTIPMINLNSGLYVLIIESKDNNYKTILIKE